MNSRGSAARVILVLALLSAIVAAAVVGYRPARPVPVPDSPPLLTAADIYRVDLAGMERAWVPVFQTQPDAADLMAEIAAVYEGARSKVTTSPLPVPEPLSMSLPFRPHLSLLLRSGVRLTLDWLVEDEVRVDWRGSGDARANWVVKDRTLAAWVQAAPLRFRLPSGQGDWLLPSRWLRLGDELTIHLEALPEADRVDVYLWPSYTPVTIPSGPRGYPVPEAALIGSPIQFEATVNYTFRLAEHIGRRPDGSPLELRPGSYNIQVGGWGAGILILPAETAPWVAAVKDGTLYAWRPEGGVRASVLDEVDVPARAADGMAYTWVTTSCLKLAGMEVRRVRGDYLIGPPDAQARIEPGNQGAVVNGTEFVLLFPCEKVGGGLRLCLGETELAFLLDCRIYWPSADQVWFVHGRPDVPLEFLERLGLLPGPGAPPRVLVNGAAVLGEAITVGGTLYVPADKFALTCHGRAWYEEGIVQVATDYGYAAVEGSRITVQDRETGAENTLAAPALTRNGKTFLPLAPLVLAWGGTLDQEADSPVVRVWFESRP